MDLTVFRHNQIYPKIQMVQRYSGLISSSSTLLSRELLRSPLQHKHYENPGIFKQRVEDLTDIILLVVLTSI
jgi:hypothetical protein